RGRQRGDGAYVLRRQAQAVGHALGAAKIVGAPAQLGIEQPASDAGEVDIAGILVLELGQAALAAAVAERFPLRRRHRLQRLGFPERLIHALIWAFRRRRSRMAGSRPRRRTMAGARLSPASRRRLAFCRGETAPPGNQVAPVQFQPPTGRLTRQETLYD